MIDYCLYLVYLREINKIFKKEQFKFCHDCLTTDDLAIITNQFGKSISNICNKCKDIKTKKVNQDNILKQLYGDKWRAFKKHGVTNEEDLIKKKKENQLKRIEKSKITCLEKYGVENVSSLQEKKDKRKNTVLERYGVENILQSEEVISAIKKTNLEKYGVENPFSSDEIKEKLRATNLEKYGDSVARRNPEVNQKIKDTNIERYGDVCPTRNEEVKKKTIETNLKRYGETFHMKTEKFKITVARTNLNRHGCFYPLNNAKNKKNTISKRRTNRYDIYVRKLKNKNIELLLTKDEYINADTGAVVKYKCTLCNNIFEHILDHETRICCYSCIKSISSYENILYDWLKDEAGIENIERNKRFYYGDHPHRYDIDLFLTNFNFGIEIHGLFYHKFTNDPNSYGITDKTKHQRQYKFFQERQIEIIQIFENEFIHKLDIVKSIILTRLGKINNKIMARKCIIKELSIDEYSLFLHENHIQGYVQSKYKIGLYYNDDLVSVMGIGKSRFNNNYDYELIRFANRKNHSITGSFNKLLSWFEKNISLNNSKIISYVDVRYFSGSSYKNNWDFIKLTDANYFYFNIRKIESNLMSRMKFQKHKLKGLLETFDEHLTEYENMMLNGYQVIFDAGNKVYTKILNKT